MKILVAVAALVGINSLAKSVMKSGSVKGSLYVGAGKLANGFVPFWVM